MFRLKRKVTIPLYISNPRTENPEDYVTAVSSLLIEHALSDMKNRKYDSNFYDSTTKEAIKVLDKKFKIRNKKKRIKVFENVEQRIYGTKSEEEIKEKTDFYIR